MTRRMQERPCPPSAATAAATRDAVAGPHPPIGEEGTQSLQIKVKARCIIRSGNRILLEEVHDTHSGETLYRPPGGNVEPGETSGDALRRELQEECGVDLVDLRLLGVLEDVGQSSPSEHQIQFIYEGRVDQASFYGRPRIEIVEGDKVRPARWMPLTGDGAPPGARIAPAGLVDLILSTPDTQQRRARS